MVHRLRFVSPLTGPCFIVWLTGSGTGVAVRSAADFTRVGNRNLHQGGDVPGIHAKQGTRNGPSVWNSLPFHIRDAAVVTVSNVV